MSTTSPGGSKKFASPKTKSPNDVSPMEDEAVKRALRDCKNAHNMIELNKNQLNGLRTQCCTKAELTQQEIRNLEGELIKLFGNQLAAKASLDNSFLSSARELESYPSLEQWLRVVGVTDKVLNHVLSSNRKWTLENLLSCSPKEVESLVSHAYGDGADAENDDSSTTAPPADESVKQKVDRDRLVDALRSLKYYTERKLGRLARGGRDRSSGGGSLGDKASGRLSSTSDSEGDAAGEAWTDDDAAEEKTGDGTVELFWSRWDDDAAADNNGVANSGTRHYSLSLGTSQGLNLVSTSPRRGSGSALQRSPNAFDALQPVNPRSGTVSPAGRGIIKRAGSTHRPSTSSIPSDELMSVGMSSTSGSGAPHYYYSPSGNELHSSAITLAPWTGLVSSQTPPETPPPSPLVITSLPYRRSTPPATPPFVRAPTKLPSTPPSGTKKSYASKGHSSSGKEAGKDGGGSWVGNLLGSGFPLTKSRSHESQLVNKIEPVNPALLEKAKRRTDTLTLVDNFQHGRRLSTEVVGSLVEGPPPASYPMMDSSYAASSSSMSDGPGASLLDNDDLGRLLSGHKSSPSSSSGSSHKSPKRIVQAPFHHKFAHALRVLTCQACSKKMLFGMKCKECKYVCHKDCISKAPVCILPGIADFYRQVVSSSSGNSPNLSSRSIPPFQLFTGPDMAPGNLPPGYPRLVGGAANSHPNIRHSSVPTRHAFGLGVNGNGAGPAFHDSSSTASSANSSTPSSPALFLNQPINAIMGGMPSCSPRPSPRIVIHPESTTSFRFPDLPVDQSRNETSTDPPKDMHHLGVDSDASQPTMPQMPVASLSPLNDGGGPKISASLVCSDPGPQSANTRENTTDLINTYNSQSSSSGSSSARTVIDSNSSEKTLPDRVDSMDSQDFDPDANRGQGGFLRQNSLSATLREWDIPFIELDVGTVIGRGRFGTVFRGIWHGEVAVKMLDMDHGGTPENQINQLTAFKSEVANFRKTRHENLVLFMGACMRPPHLAIVTSLCRGKTLYTLLHEPAHKEKFSMNKIIQIATQTANGIGYLHARGIIHKDLKSKNIFIENLNKVVITDFGLFSLIKLCPHKNREALMIPKGWLSYLSPEVLRALSATKQDEDLPFSKATDVFAYGTVWFELICHEIPHRRLQPEVHIWQGGNGKLRIPEAMDQHPREVRELLHQCWTAQPEERITFKAIMEKLEILSKKRLARSPSHPVHLFKSAESVF